MKNREIYYLVVKKIIAYGAIKKNEPNNYLIVIGFRNIVFFLNK